MRTIHFGLGLAAAAAIAVAMPVAAETVSPAPAAAWQGQGNQGRGNDDHGRAQGNRGRDEGRPAAARGNQGRGNDGQPAARGNQGRGNDGQPAARGNRGRGNDGQPAARGNPGRGNSAAAHRRNPARPDAARLRASIDRLPDPVRRMSSSERRNERIVASALARASLRGADAGDFLVVSRDGRVRVTNSNDRVLLDLDEARARDLGYWEMRRLGDRRPGGNSPAFCRSGAGHPVWGRDWCLDKGFGLGVDDRTIWSRTDDLDDVIFVRRPTRDVLDRGGLIEVLGDIVLGRLAVQSLILGYDEPLVGRWVASDERDAPFVLRVSAGDVAVAEFVDVDRDDEVDVLFVSQPRY